MKPIIFTSFAAEIPSARSKSMRTVEVKARSYRQARRFLRMMHGVSNTQIKNLRKLPSKTLIFEE